MKALVFPIESYDRWGQLEGLSDKELIALAREDDDVLTYTLKEFQQACNGEEIDLNGCWVYFVDDAKQKPSKDAKQKPSKEETKYNLCVQVMGAIKVTKEEMQAIMEEGGDKVMRNIIKNTFNPYGYVCLCEGDIDFVNQTLGTDYHEDYGEWEI